MAYHLHSDTRRVPNPITPTQSGSNWIERSAIRTDAVQADGGDVEIRAEFIELRNTEIVTSVGNGSGQGGNVAVDTDLGLLERSEIRADAFGGPGGNITIQANGLIADVDSVVSASSEQSVDGTVSIQGLADLSGSLAPIDPSFASASALQRNRCADRLRGRGISRFTLAGRDRIPIEPDGLLPSLTDKSGCRTCRRFSSAEGQPLTSWAHTPNAALERNCDSNKFAQ